MGCSSLRGDLRLAARRQIRIRMTRPPTRAPRRFGRGASGSTLRPVPVLKLEVAATRPFELVFEIAGKPPRYDATWDELPRAVVEIEPSRSLRDALRVACDELGVQRTREVIEAGTRYGREEGLPPASSDAADALVYVDFWRPGDDDIVDSFTDPPILGRGVRRPAINLTVRDPSGRAIWRKPGLDASLEEIVDAASAGLVDGDPLRPYLHPSIPQGDAGALSEWLTFGHALKVIGGAYLAANAASAVEGTLALVQRVRKRGEQVADAAEIVGRSAPTWKERDAAPADLLQMLARRPRPTAEIAALLGCSALEAESLLWGLGFHYVPDEGVWVHAGDPLAKLLADDIDLGFADVIVVSGDTESLRHVVIDRLDDFLATGDAPNPSTGQARLQSVLLNSIAGTHWPNPRRLVRRIRRAILRRR